MAENILHSGDSLDALRRYVKDEPVGRIYVHPPFDSNTTLGGSRVHGDKGGDSRCQRSSARRRTRWPVIG